MTRYAKEASERLCRRNMSNVTVVHGGGVELLLLSMLQTVEEMVAAENDIVAAGPSAGILVDGRRS